MPGAVMTTLELVEPTTPRAPQSAVAVRRMAQIVDAAAQIVDESGSERLTTSSVAQRAGIAIGSIYRYFPDRVAILVELGRRSRGRLRCALDATFRIGRPTIDESIDAFVDAVAEHYATEPAVRSVGMGDRLDLGIDRDACQWVQVAEPFAAALVRDHQVAPALASVAVDTAGPMVDALVALAYRDRATAEPTYLQHARLVARGSIRRVVG